MVTDSSKLLGLVVGTCTLQSLLGRGGMGTVYLAQQSRPRRTVAVKVLMPTIDEEKPREAFLARFRREADAVAALDHVNIMPIYEYGEQEELAYLVMPYVPGGTLRDHLAKQGILPIDEVMTIIDQAASALDYAHKKGIIHRDLKPGNILFHSDGRALLADFGLAKVVRGEDGSADNSPTLTSAGTIIGTPEYLSPEQSTGLPVDARTDIYALGIILYQMLGGSVPFTGSSPIAIALKHTMENPPPLLKLNPSLSHGIEEVVMKALAKEPDQRYASAGALAHALRTAVLEMHPTLSFLPKHYELSPSPRLMLKPDEVRTDNLNMQAYEAPTEEALRLPPTVSPVMSAPQQPALPSNEGRVSMPLAAPNAPAWTFEEPSRPLRPQEPPPPAQRKGCQSTQMKILGTLVALLLVVGGFVTYLTMFPLASQPTGTGQQKTPTQSVKKQFTPPAATITKAGELLYATDMPGPKCDTQGAQWQKSGSAQISCTNATELINTGGGYLAALSMRSLPDNKPIPQNYVLQVQFKINTSSQGSFGLLFHDQIDANKGGMALLLHPASNGWTISAHANYTDQMKPFITQSMATKLKETMTLDFLVTGNNFEIYLNGVQVGYGYTGSQYLANNGIGLVVTSGGDITFNNFAIYALN